jgi:endonuclease YncB( thermonuclease family)
VHALRVAASFDQGEIRAFLGVPMLRWILAVLIVSGFWNAAADPIAPSDIQVTDGDTIRADGKTYRLVGFDTPEIARRAQCNAERIMGHKAAIRLIEIVDGGDLDLTEIRCSCPRAAIGTKHCNYGRRCAKLTAKSKDVGEILAADGFAK